MCNEPPKPRIAAVSFLNSVPLVWGMMQGPQRNAVDLSFCLPSECADRVRAGAADIGLLPVVEMARQNLEHVPALGIACQGPVRSILLFSRVPWQQIRRVAMDASSRSSVMLARIILRERYGVDPEVMIRPPRLASMMGEADAALLIGDPALRTNLGTTPFAWLDLGEEWWQLTGLPMVFAVWSGKGIEPGLAQVFRESWEYGRNRLPEIIDHQSDRRGIARSVVREYLTRYIRFELGDNEQRGMRQYLQLAAALEPAITL